MSDELEVKTNIFNGLNLQNSEIVQNDVRSFSIEPTILQIGLNYYITPNFDEFDVLFYEKAGNSLHIPELEFTNFDSEFPSHTTIRNGFDLISKDIKTALLKDTEWIKNLSNFKEHLLPILQKYIPNYFSSELNNGEYTEFIESRIHKNIEKGSFRIFSKYIPKGSFWTNGDKVEKNTLIVLFYDPFHLVFMDRYQQKNITNTNKYSRVESHNKHIRSRYYDKIPKELRIDISNKFKGTGKQSPDDLISD